MLKQASCCVLLWLVAGSVWAQDFERQKLQNWHQFRGPQDTGVAPMGNPPIEWSETKNIKWKVPIPGSGSASPIVWGNRIFILTAIKTDRTAESAERTTSTAGATIRQVAYSPNELLAQRDENRRGDAQRGDAQRGDGQRGERGRGQGRGGFGGQGRGGFGGGRGGFGITPPTNYHKFVVMCIDRNSGETLWERTAAEVVPHEGHHDTNTFASASPFTDGQHVYAFFGSRGIHCYDLDGNPIWDKDLGDMQTRFSFGEGSSPTVYGDTMVITWDHEGGSFIVALDARNGNEKWRKPRDEVSTWASPLIVEAAGRTQVVTSGDNAIRSYDLANGELLWQCGGLGSNPIATPVVSEGIVICMTGHRDPAGIAVPLDARGDVTDSDKTAWRIENTPYIASPVLYDGLLYFTKGRDAILSSVDAKTGEVVIQTERLPDLSTLYSSPVAAAGRIYISSREGNTIVLKHGREFEVLATNSLDEQTIDATPAIVGNELILRGQSHLYCIAEE
jgi:outer membrane protein assembly factor BamB